MELDARTKGLLGSEDAPHLHDQGRNNPSLAGALGTSMTALIREVEQSMEGG